MPWAVSQRSFCWWPSLKSPLLSSLGGVSPPVCFPILLALLFQRVLPKTFRSASHKCLCVFYTKRIFSWNNHCNVPNDWAVHGIYMSRVLIPCWLLSFLGGRLAPRLVFCLQSASLFKYWGLEVRIVSLKHSAQVIYNCFKWPMLWIVAFLHYLSYFAVVFPTHGHARYYLS